MRAAASFGGGFDYKVIKISGDRNADVDLLADKIFSPKQILFHQ